MITQELTVVSMTEQKLIELKSLLKQLNLENSDLIKLNSFSVEIDEQELESFIEEINDLISENFNDICHHVDFGMNGTQIEVESFSVSSPKLLELLKTLFDEPNYLGNFFAKLEREEYIESFGMKLRDIIYYHTQSSSLETNSPVFEISGDRDVTLTEFRHFNLDDLISEEVKDLISEFNSED